MICLKVLSLLVRLPGPNLGSFAPCPRWTVHIRLFWVRTAVRLRHQASSCLPRCLITTAQEKAAKCITLLSALLFIYVFEPFVSFTKLNAKRHLRLSYKWTADALKNAEGEQKWDIQLSACSASITLVRKVSETHIKTIFYQIVRH